MTYVELQQRLYCRLEEFRTCCNGGNSDSKRRDERNAKRGDDDVESSKNKLGFQQICNIGITYFDLETQSN